MKAGRFGLLFLGGAALAIFIAMGVLLQIWIRPETRFLPQASLLPYTQGELFVFGQVLKDAELIDLYRNIIVYLDSAFITVFFLWVTLGHVLQATGVWKAFGPAMAAAACLLDVAENLRILSALDISSIAPDLLNETSGVYMLSVAKFSAFTVCLILMALRVRQGRR